MIEVKPVTILLWLELRRYPLARLDADVRTSDCLTVLTPPGALAIFALTFHPVVGRVVGYIDHLVSVDISLRCARERIPGREIMLCICQPSEDCRLVGHILCGADTTQAFAVSQPLAYRVCNLLRER